MNKDEIDKIIKNIFLDKFNVSYEEFSDNLTYMNVIRWDSLGHVSLILSLEDNFNIEIKHEDAIKLLSVADIKNFLYRVYDLNIENLNEAATAEPKQVLRGLNNVYLDTSKITLIDDQNSKLYYRGYDIEDLVSCCSYEEVSYLLIYGVLPTLTELKEYKEILLHSRTIPSKLLMQLEKLLSLNLDTASLLRVMILLVSEEVKDKKDYNFLSIISLLPTILCYIHGIEQGNKIIADCKNLSHSDFVYSALTGKKIDSRSCSDVFEKQMIIHADHCCNASTLSARVTMSTKSDMYSAICSAISTFIGELHGGAIHSLNKMIEEIINNNLDISSYIKEKKLNNMPIFGFGHRIYKNVDPRSKILSSLVNTIKNTECFNMDFNKIDHILKQMIFEMRDYARIGININVDFYSFFLMKLIGIPNNCYTASFIAGRISGWIAHCLEQKESNVLIRPKLMYQGLINNEINKI